MAGKDFRAAFSNMNQAVRPGIEQPVVKKKDDSCREKSIYAWSTDLFVR